MPRTDRFLKPVVFERAVSSEMALLRLAFHLRAVPTERKYAVLCTGISMTRHPRMGAVEQPQVAERGFVETAANRQKRLCWRYPRGKRTLLMGNLMSCSPLARLRPRCPMLSNARRACGLSLKSLSGGAL